MVLGDREHRACASRRRRTRCGEWNEAGMLDCGPVLRAAAGEMHHHGVIGGRGVFPKDPYRTVQGFDQDCTFRVDLAGELVMPVLDQIRAEPADGARRRVSNLWVDDEHAAAAETDRP